MVHLKKDTVIHITTSLQASGGKESSFKVTHVILLVVGELAPGPHAYH